MKILLYYTEEYYHRSSCYKLLMRPEMTNRYDLKLFYKTDQTPIPTFRENFDAILLRTSVSGTEEDFSFVSGYKNTPIINSVSATRNCASKIISCEILRENNVPMAGYKILTSETLPGSNMKYPFVLKHPVSSQGRSVYLVQNESEALALMLPETHYICENFVEESFGLAVRVLMIGEKYTAYLRKAPAGEIVANLSRGTPYPIDVTPDMLKACLLAKNAMNLDIVGVDVLFGPNGQYYICDVNSAPGYFIPDFCGMDASLETYKYLENLL